MLKSLDMFGFKSFADRTRFDFSRGITCVVGPNGSGKSNVVDAIKWVLGDQSPKSLRGKEMTDVIFNGASGRKPSAFSEVTLTFDNAARFLSLDAAEVQIGRRLWRSGDSEYLINQQPARLKDIKDLFLGTGGGSSGYSIIEQGRVDQILQANAAARRHVFEEAAGVSRYKTRKEEATRKLERVDQNLLRLRDIVDEVESQLNTTRTQASKAAKYRELSAELREWWFGLAADDHRHFSAQLTTAETELRAGEAQLAELTSRQQELEQKLSVFDAEL
ncbi:MAG TPA: AAA family ATPase, partial [Planctomycetaceae bacterium]|nr:AAA family ATPase [Planctomycetaceae bacterium]